MTNLTEKVANTATEKVSNTVTEKVANILHTLNEDLVHHKTLLSKYKRYHCIMIKSQLFLNILSIALGSSAAVTIASGIGSPAGLILSSLTASSAGLDILCNLLNERVLKKTNKHYQLMILARTIDLKLFEKYLYNGEITEEDFTQILNMMGKYYQERDLIESKSLSNEGNINELSKQFKILLNGTK